MPFYPPAWVPKLPFDPPDSISIQDFILDERYGRHPLGYSKAPFVCGLSGKSYSALDVKDRVDYLARGLAKELGWQPNVGTEWDKVIAVFSVNTVSGAAPTCYEAIADFRSLIHFPWHGLPIASVASNRQPMPHTNCLSSCTSSKTRAQRSSSPAFRSSRPRKKLHRNVAYRAIGYTS
jgi:hypothetical protein